MTDTTEQIGYVLRASTSGFDFGTRGNHINEQHSFGSFVLTQVAGDGVPCYAIGLIYAIRISDDPFVRELVMAESLDASALMDQRQNRLIPIETMVLNIGYVYADGIIVHSMPPRPPLSLTPVYLLEREMVLEKSHRMICWRRLFAIVRRSTPVKPKGRGSWCVVVNKWHGLSPMTCAVFNISST